MMNEKSSVEEGFYQTCAAMLGVAYQYKPGPYRLTRWNNRNPGNGRFPGYGMIRMYGPNSIHVCLRHPEVVNRRCTSMDEVFELIRGMIHDQHRPEGGS